MYSLLAEQKCYGKFVASVPGKDRRRDEEEEEEGERLPGRRVSRLGGETYGRFHLKMLSRTAMMTDDDVE